MFLLREARQIILSAVSKGDQDTRYIMFIHFAVWVCGKTIRSVFCLFDLNL